MLVLVLTAGCSEETADPYSEYDSLTAAVLAKDVNAVEWFLANGADSNEHIQEHGSIPPLMVAVNNDDIVIAKILLETGADIDATLPDHLMETIFAAARQGDAQAVDFIKSTGVPSVEEFEGSLEEVLMIGTEKITSLWSAASKGQTEIVRLLLQYDPDLEVRATAGSTALDAAAEIGYSAIVKLLLNQGAEVNVLDMAGGTPLFGAAGNGHLDVVQLLLDYGADPELRSNNAQGLMEWTASESQINTLKLFLDRGIDIHRPGFYGLSAIHGAALSGSAETLAFLIDNGADIDDLTDEGLTPSHIAAWEGNEETLEWLVKNGADIEVKRAKSQKTPLLLAVDQGHLEIIRILLKSGANVRAETNRGFDALKLAIQYENADIASLIRSYIED